MTSKAINADKRPPEPEPERKDVRPAKTNSEFMKNHFRNKAILFKRKEHMEKLKREGNPVIFSADGSENLFKKVEVKPIPRTKSKEDDSVLFSADGSEELFTRTPVKPISYGPVRGIGAEIHSRKGQLRKKRKRTKKTKKDKKTKKAKKKSSK